MICKYTSILRGKPQFLISLNFCIFIAINVHGQRFMPYETLVFKCLFNFSNGHSRVNFLYFLLLLPKFSEIGTDFLGIKHYTVVLFSSKGTKFEIDDEKPYVTLPLLAPLKLVKGIFFNFSIPLNDNNFWKV